VRTRPARTRVERGIYADTYGLSAIVTVRGRQQEKRFPLDHPRELIRRWRQQAALDLDEELQGVGLTGDRHSLEADIRTYLQRREGRPGFKADRSHFKAWIALYGPRPRRSLTRHDIDTAIAGWRSSNVSAQTIKHRCRALRQLYLALDGPDVKHPLRRLRLGRPIRPAPTPVPRAVIQKVATNLKRGNAHAYARFLFRATTGQRPTQIMQAQPGDVDLKRKIWYVRPAKGGDPIPLPLNPGMVQAWKAFIAADAWGPFDTTNHARYLREAGWPDGIRPYALRHTFAIELLRAGVDLGDLQGLLGHADIQTTRIYAPMLLSRLTTAVQKRRLTLPGYQAATKSGVRPGKNSQQKSTQDRTKQKSRAEGERAK
jgi:integrase